MTKSPRSGTQSIERALHVLRELGVARDGEMLPVEALTAEFERGATPLEICARTMQAMMRLGVRNFYVSNLPLIGAASMLDELRTLVGLT